MKGKRFYRDKFGGKLFGVCAGIGDYFEINALWIRLGLIVLIFVGAAPFVIIGYFVAALVTDAKPPHMYLDSLTRTFDDTFDQEPRPARRREWNDE